MTRWRQGQSVPHHVYAMRGDEPDTRPFPMGDRPVATFLDPDDAELCVRAMNATSPAAEELRSIARILRSHSYADTPFMKGLRTGHLGCADALDEHAEKLDGRRADTTEEESCGYCTHRELAAGHRRDCPYRRPDERGVAGKVSRLDGEPTVGMLGLTDEYRHDDCATCGTKADPVILQHPAGYTLAEQVQAVWDEEGPDGVADAIRRVARGEET